MSLEEKIKNLDKQNVLQSLRYLSDQLKQAWEETACLEYPESYKAVKNIVLAGMGGSIYSYYVTSSLFSNQLKIPFVLANNYDLPEFVNQDSLVIASSYSGTTEEVISAAKLALERKAKLTFISNGGRLKEIADENSLPGYFFDPRYNPSKQPRMGFGYMIMGTMGILKKLAFIDLDNGIVNQGLQIMKDEEKKIAEITTNLAAELKNKYLMIVAGEHLSGNAHILRNQINENAKQLAMYALIPELNHYLMEGLSFPNGNKPSFIFLNSKKYSPRIRRRFQLTEEVVKKNGASVFNLNIDCPTQLAEFMIASCYGGYLSFYLAIENNINPSEIPWVDFFKKKMLE